MRLPTSPCQLSRPWCIVLVERGLGSWHAEWLAIPLVFQTCGAALEAIGNALASLEVEPSALIVAPDRQAAADAFLNSVLEQSP